MMPANVAVGNCPADVDELADEYCLNRLPQQARLAFEDHYLTCPECAAVVEATQEFIDQIRLVLGKALSSTSVC
jgi:anti-sigma factor RsiW